MNRTQALSLIEIVGNLIDELDRSCDLDYLDLSVNVVSKLEALEAELIDEEREEAADLKERLLIED